VRRLKRDAGGGRRGGGGADGVVWEAGGVRDTGGIGA
jgi:hypothetical protein